ncbi:MAG: hypothetical protein ACREKJ_16650 [Candidatus Rokuibacteriota bacterium]
MTIPTESIGSIPRPVELIEAVAAKAGFLAHVSKPVDPSGLVATIGSVVGRTGEPL